MKLSELWKCCLNPKVIIFVLLLAGGLFLFLPKIQTVSLIPILLSLICPISMGIMIIRMNKNKSCDTSQEKERLKESNSTITNSRKKL